MYTWLILDDDWWQFEKGILELGFETMEIKVFWKWKPCGHQVNL